MTNFLPVWRLFLSSTLLLAACSEQPGGTGASGRGEPLTGTGIRFLSTTDSSGYARAEEPRPIQLPGDHGPHPEFRSEWWYFTGNLANTDSREFGFELTFFRYALAPGLPVSASAWRANQLWLAHFAISDPATGQFLTAEKVSRGALGLAGAESDRLAVNLADWSAAENPDTGVIHLSALTDDAAISLDLTAIKPMVLQGERGLDRKGPQPGNASYYYSIPRLHVAGELRVGQEAPHFVTGLAWLDREWGTSSLDADTEGWDWFALHLDDGRDLMLYRLRRPDGGSTPFSGGSVSHNDGSVTALGRDDFRLTELSDWTSQRTGITYPSRWQLEIDSENLSLLVEPMLQDQEVDLTVRYWEGAVRVFHNGLPEPVGRGYTELAGYSGANVP